MNSVQESKQELQAAIRYAENAISSANATIESMEFRQEMAKKNRQEQTGREQALEAEAKALKQANMSLVCDNDDLKDEITALKNEVEKLRKEKQASSGSCGCQGYRDLHDEAARLKSDNLRLKASLDAAEEHMKDMREDLNDQKKMDEQVRQGVNDFLNFLEDIDYEKA